MSKMEEFETIWPDLVQLARLSLLGKQRDVQVFIRRLANRYKQKAPELAEQLGVLLRQANAGSGSSVLRGSVVEAIPVDLDSRLYLARPEYPVQMEVEPHWPREIRERLDQIVSERLKEVDLFRENLHPTRTALFTGPPGVGKTLAARWIAHRLDRPLIVLDLAAVMSSFLGRTGNNVRHVIDYAKGVPCVFLLDEFDAIAKRRDDVTEVGELKRLVTVLLQEIDQWPTSGLLIAATNHKDLLDPAAWRRFEAIIDFGMPSEESVSRTIELYLGEAPLHKRWIAVLTKVLEGLSYADIEREIQRGRRESVILGEPLQERFRNLVRERAHSIPRKQRNELALALIEAGLSQREAHDWTGVSRDTIRKQQG